MAFHPTTTATLGAEVSNTVLVETLPALAMSSSQGLSPLHSHPVHLSPLLSPVGPHPSTNYAIPPSQSDRAHPQLNPHNNPLTENEYQRTLNKAFSDIVRLETAFANAERVFISERSRCAREVQRKQMKIKGLSTSVTLMARAYVELAQLLSVEEDE
ncbi:hypothetical protein BKA70DRAFT_1427624 [Coprinopsis sp. MPI-PUGE-AT-0042]|nr:hypothetical protein BKA70DRAFT_1427624 [Coprinopsis sp. MPI-PUGE-AT-0042]